MANPQPALVRSKTAATALPLVSPDELFYEIKGLLDTIAARAYDLFESRGREHGRDWEDWFRAEAELLRPVAVKLKGSAKAFVARVDLAGFRPENIRVSLEPLYMRLSAKSSRKQKREVHRSAHSPKQGEHVFRVVALPANVNTSRATAKFEEGVLEVVVPRATVEGGHRDSLS